MLQLRDQGSMEDVLFEDIIIHAQHYEADWWGAGEAITLTAQQRNQTQREVRALQALPFSDPPRTSTCVWCAVPWAQALHAWLLARQALLRLQAAFCERLRLPASCPAGVGCHMRVTPGPAAAAGPDPGGDLPQHHGLHRERRRGGWQPRQRSGGRGH